jgi:WD40 repeat protein
MSSSRAVQKPQPNFIESWNYKFVHTFETNFGWFSSIRAVSISKDGQFFANGSDSGIVKLWNLNTGQELFTISEHKKPIRSITFSSDKRVLFVSSDDGSISLWDTSTGQVISVLLGHKKAVTSISLSPNENILASCSDDKTVKLWDLAKSQEIKTLLRHSNYVQCVCFSPDGLTVASADCDNKIKLKSISGEQETKVISGHIDIVSTIIFSPNGEIVISGSHDKTIRLWNSITGQKLGLINCPAKINALSISSNGQLIVSGDDDGKIRIYNIRTGNLLSTLATNSDCVSSVDIDGGSQFVISGDYSNRTTLWWIEKPKIQPSKEISNHTTFKENIYLLFFILSTFILPIPLLLFLGFIKGALSWVFIVLVSIILCPFENKSIQKVASEETQKMPDFVRTKIEQNQARSLQDLQKEKQQQSKNKNSEVNSNPLVDIAADLLFGIISSKLHNNSNRVYVGSYRRRDGTFVRSHWRNK